MKRKQFKTHYLTHEGKIYEEQPVEGLNDYMLYLLNGRQGAGTVSSDNLYKAQQEAMREWIIKMRW